jgi:putative hemolysin
LTVSGCSCLECCIGCREPPKGGTTNLTRRRENVTLRSLCRHIGVRESVVFQLSPLSLAHPFPRMTTPQLQSPRLATYNVRLAQGAADIEAAQRLRFEVFNLELNEGLDTAYLSGLDADRFDECCDHLLVEEARSGAVVGTYRLQTGQLAAANLGYYSAQFESIRCETVELGRACVHKDHRRLNVVNLLWRGIARYATERKARYLIGCSSLTSQDAALGAAMYEALRGEHLVEECFRTEPVGDYRFDINVSGTERLPVPKLLRAYLAIGAKICGPPALDREFKTIDFLTLLDLRALPAAVRNHFLD